ncbi:MAG: tRNA (adenosine(37)-N6)-threonylcarbamoyltransferase complex transferase subunit TsaD [Candidatus Woesearchaeota archaeon]
MANNNERDWLILGIECTAHTIGASIIDSNAKILSNHNISMKSNDSGLIPVEIMEHHASNIKNIILESLIRSEKSIDDITHIAVSNSPGMGHALRVGNIMTKALSFSKQIPIIPVNHSLAHLTTGIVLYPPNTNITLLYAAGANTQLWNLSENRLMMVGETLDMGIGHLLDICARTIGYGFPGGPIIEELASRHDGSLIELPYSIKGMDVSYGGISTSYKNKASKIIGDYNDSKISIDEKDIMLNALCYSLQEHAYGVLIEATERAMALQESLGLSVIGGVALNKRFLEMANIMCSDRNASIIIPNKELLADNAGMIALEGLRMLYSGYKPMVHDYNNSLRIDPYERLPRITDYHRLNSVSLQHSSS